MNAEDLHESAVIVDGLVFYGDGETRTLRAGNIAAVNLTVSHFEGGFEEACDGIARWLEIVAAPGSGWRVVETVADIETARARGEIGLIMGWQNMRPIEDKLDRLAFFRRLGIRVMQLTYNRRNFLGDGCIERANDGGLSSLGELVVKRMNELGIAIDLSHVGERATLRAADLSTKPVLITHANASALVDVPRNKSDAAIEAVAATGGTIGVSIYGPFCWQGNPERRPRLDDFLRHLEHVVDRVGVDHVAFGTDLPAVSDLDKVAPITALTLSRFPSVIGAYAAAFGNDVRARYLEDCGSHAELIKITRLLLERGWPEASVRGFLGGNLIRALDLIWS